MELFDTVEQHVERSPLEAFGEFIEKGDAKRAVDVLRQLDKAALGETLIKSGFSLKGNYREWIDHAATDILNAAKLGRFPRLNPKNDTAASLLKKFDFLCLSAKGAYSSAQRYCLATEVSSYEEALRVGMALGDGWGEIETVQATNHRVTVIFCHAHVSA